MGYKPLSNRITVLYGHFLFAAASFQRFERVDVGIPSFLAASIWGNVSKWVISTYLASLDCIELLRFTVALAIATVALGKERERSSMGWFVSDGTEFSSVFT